MKENEFTNSLDKIDFIVDRTLGTEIKWEIPGIYFFNSNGKINCMVLTAMDANRIAIEKSLLMAELNKVHNIIKNKSLEGALAVEIESLNGPTVDTLLKLGFKCWMNQGLGTWTVSWMEPEKASIAIVDTPVPEWAEKYLEKSVEMHTKAFPQSESSSADTALPVEFTVKDFSKEIVRIKNIHGNVIWSTEEFWVQQECEKKQQELLAKSEKQKARYKAIELARAVHGDNYRTPDADQRYEEVLATADKIYEWFIKGGHIDLDSLENVKL